MNKFKDKAAQHQEWFKINKLLIVEDGYFYRKIVHPKTKVIIDEKRKIEFPYFLPVDKAKKGLNYFKGYINQVQNYISEVGFNFMRDANMLRSEHIPLNLFIPMRDSMEQTKILFNQLLGKDVILSINSIQIEKSGKEDKSKYLNDGTSFDTRIDFTHINGGNGYIGIEVKYTEEGYKIKPESKEYKDIWNKENTRYQIISDKSNYYIGNKYDELKQNEFRQIWRNHILGAAIIQSGNEIDHFYHIHLYPQGNEYFEKTIPEYQKLLSERGKETFIPITYEKLFSEMEKLFCENEMQRNWVKYLKERYLVN